MVANEEAERPAGEWAAGVVESSKKTRVVVIGLGMVGIAFM